MSKNRQCIINIFKNLKSYNVLKYIAHTLIFFLVITYLPIAVVIPPKIEFPSSNSICHPSSLRKANEDDKKILFLIYSAETRENTYTYHRTNVIRLVYTKSIL